MPFNVSESTGTESCGESDSSMDSRELDRLVAEVSNSRSLSSRREAAMQQWTVRQHDGTQSPISLDTSHDDDIKDEEAEDDDEGEEFENLDSCGEEDTTVPQDEEKGDDANDGSGLCLAASPEIVDFGGASAGTPPKATSAQSGTDSDTYDFDDGGGFLPKYQDTQAMDSLNRELDVFGLSRVSLSKPSELVSTFWDTLTELKERGRVVHTQADEIARLQSCLDHVNLIDEDLAERIEKSKHAVSVAESRAEAAEMELNSFRASKAEGMKRMHIELSNTAAQLRQSKHRMTAKEVVNSRLMKKLHDVAKRDRLKASEGGGEKLQGLHTELVQKRSEVGIMILWLLLTLFFRNIQ